jgi:hypothetical protein
MPKVGKKVIFVLAVFGFYELQRAVSSLIYKINISSC